MRTFAEIETAAKNLPPAEREKLVLSLSTKATTARRERAKSLHLEGDRLLVAPASAPAMTPERVKQLLEESP
jgi:hypothetical protein